MVLASCALIGGANPNVQGGVVNELGNARLHHHIVVTDNGRQLYNDVVTKMTTHLDQPYATLYSNNTTTAHFQDRGPAS
jgi:hypothetical protein